MSAAALQAHAHWAAIDAAALDVIVPIESTAYAHPWQRRHFADSLAAGYTLQMLLLPAQATPATATWQRAPALPDGRYVLGYWVAMPGVDEAHLLNLTTVPQHQRQGWARCMMQALLGWAQTQAAQTLWLEVRASNTAARALYAACGFAVVGVRKAYYPNGAGPREDAIVMQRPLGQG